MNFLAEPDLLFPIIEGIESDLNLLADVFAGATTGDNFSTFYTICEEFKLLSIYDYRPAALKSKSTQRVQQHYNLLTEILLRGAKRIWTNPRNNFKKRIAGFYMISILYINQPMPGCPIKIPLDAKETFCGIVYLYEILVKSAKQIPRFLFICKEVGNIFNRLLAGNAFEFTVESEQFNILPERRVIIETYQSLDFPERRSRIGIRQFSLAAAASSAQKKNVEEKRSLLPSFSKSPTCTSSNSMMSTNAVYDAGNQTETPKGMEIVCYNREINSSSESWVSSQKASYQLNQSGEDDNDSECEERDDDDGYELLLSGDVPQPEESGSYRKTATSMQAQDEALRFLMHKNIFKPSRSRYSSQEERGKADVNLILRTIEVAKERCYTADGDNQVKRDGNEQFFPPEFMKLKQAAIESVRINYGVIQREAPMTEQMWLSKDVRNGSKALSIFNMHQQGTLEKNEGIRLVTKYLIDNVAQVLVERVGTGMDEENLYPNETKKRIKAEYENKDCRIEVCSWDSYFYQSKYINNYHRQLQNIVLDVQNKFLIDPWADRFVKRFRLDNESTKSKPLLVLHTDENQKDNWLVNNFFTRRINTTNPGLELPVYYKYFRRQECMLPLKNLNSNDVEMSEEPVEDQEANVELTEQPQNSACKSLVTSPMKDLMFPIQTTYYYDVKVKEYSDEEITEFENKTASTSSSHKILSMPNLDTFFSMD